MNEQALLGAWGARAGALIEREGARAAAAIDARWAAPHRERALTVAGAPHGAHGGWCCWLFGDPEADGGLEVRPGAGLADALARALGEQGEAACALLRGRFVAVAYERARARCWVVRDQLGAQPLVYARAADGVIFAEHERVLLELLPSTPGADRLGVLEWVQNGCPPAGRTLFAGVLRLPAAHRLTFAASCAGSAPAVERWWQARYDGVAREDAAELAARLRDAAFAAVARAAAGARRPGVQLSGGLDSTCVAAGLAAAGFGDGRAGDPGEGSGGGSGGLSTASSSTDRPAAAGLADGRAVALGGTFATDPEADERELIEATAAHTGLALALVEHDPARSMLAPALAHIERWRLPPGTPNLFLWRPLLARARELGVDLMLDGEGGDELFGLAPALIADRLRAGRLREAWSLAGRIPGVGAHPGVRLRARVLRRHGLRPLAPGAVRARRDARAAHAGAEGAIVPPADARALAELRAAWEADRPSGPLWWRAQVARVIGMRDLLDMGGHFRREAIDERIAWRHPFLYDLRLVQAALRIAPQAQFDPVRDRPLLRDGLRGRIPEQVRTRHVKSHFTMLVLAAMRAEEAELIGPLRAEDAPLREYVAAEPLQRLLAVPAAQRRVLTAGPLWRLAIANHWLLALAGGRDSTADALH
ncbi:MAG TPA: asparagine synthase-related protein [Solirubrobacteraceae bacterium]|nr:asparagine synthase-related protein [Solirubrobacteraceae bacterium]